MDGADAALGAWASIRGFFTPAMLFLVVNLVIGTIVLTSRSHQRRRRGYSHEDDDAAHHQEPIHQVQQQENQYYHEQEQQQQYVPTPLERTSSVLDRLRSIGLYRFRSGDFPPEYAAAAAATDPQDAIAQAAGDAHYARSRSEPAPVREKRRAAPSRMKKPSSEVRKAEVARAPTRLVEAALLEDEDVVDARAGEFTDNFTQPPPPQEEELYYQEEYVPPPAPAPLARTSSVLDRLRSFSLYRFRSGDLAPELAAGAPTHAQDAATAAAEEKKQAQAAHYARSRSEPAREQNKKQHPAADARMSKSSTVARKAPSEEAEAESVDARADNFINSFRQQLQLQRLNSLLNYKEMLNRGAK